MKCCVECFQSNYIRDIIQTSHDVGKCDFCGTKSINLLPPEKLIDNFRVFIDAYKPIKNPPVNCKPDKIEKRILIDFNRKIFSSKKEREVKKLLRAIFKNELNNYREIFTKNVYLECLLDPNSLLQLSNLQISWDNFVKEIKNENRYHIKNTVDLIKLEKLLSWFTREIKKGQLFYRARISEKNGFSKKEMGAPPQNQTKSGRANPLGISYLYLSSDSETTFYETRALLFDYVTIGEFKLCENIKIVNLKDTHIYDPIQFAESDSLTELLIYLPFINRLEEELSKPLRRSDNELDYIPTQYISEFIKSLKYAGVQYKSSLNPSGYNLAIFEFQKFICTGVKIHEVKEIKFKHKPI